MASTTGKVGDLSGFRLKHADAVVDILADARPAAVDPGQRRSRREHDPGSKRDQRNEVAAVERQRDHSSAAPPRN